MTRRTVRVHRLVAEAFIEIECEVTNWAEMPKYKGKDVGND